MWKKRENIDFLMRGMSNSNVNLNRALIMMSRLLYTLLLYLSVRMVHVTNYVPLCAVYSSNKTLLTVGHCQSCGEWCDRPRGGHRTWMNILIWKKNSSTPKFILLNLIKEESIN